MPSLYMGPETLRFQAIVIDRVVQHESGNYVLGDRDEAGEFIPMFIGRSDVDLNEELKSKLSTGFPFFKFSLTPPVFAFQLECSQFHSFQGKLQNKNHPQAPAGSGEKCFTCGA